jgi:hypothetical protein
MPSVKSISLHTAQGTALTVYVIVQRNSDGYLLDDSDGAFKSAPADSYLSLAEHSTIKGRYEVAESRVLWADGAYSIAAYIQSGGSPSPASDNLVGTGEMFIDADVEINALNARALMASQSQSIDSISSAVDSNLDVAVSTRATAGDFLGELTPGVFQSMVTVTDSSAQNLVRGDAGTLSFSLGAGWDLTGRKIYFIAKELRTADNSTSIVNRECAVTDAFNALATITLTSLETATVGAYYAELEVRESDDTLPRTALQFRLNITQDVRQ